MRILVESTLIVEVPDDIDPLDEATYPDKVGITVPFGGVEYRAVSVTRIVTPADARCDFCGEVPTYLYDADDFLTGIVVDDVAEGSAGAWLACADCSWCIETNDFTNLRARALTRFQGEPAFEEMFVLLDEIYAKFRAHRRGERKVLA